MNGQLPPYYALETILSELSEVPELSGFIVVKDNELNAIEKPAETITIIDFYRYSTAILDYVKSSNTDSLALHTEALDSWGTEIICILLTNLHAKFVEYYLADPGVEFPREKFPDAKALAEATLRQFSRRNLRAVTRFGVGAIIRPVEATYQDEFYRSLHTVLGYAMNVTSEWSPDGVGRIDFRLSSVRWGIELLREGDRLHDHCQRFTTDGAYGKWIQQGLLEDWLVIDCRTSSPRSYDTKLWRAVFAPDFSDVEVRDQYNQVVVDRFALTE
ncbi:hypothetical protein EN45_027940 [Penicillium chrysogenum]|uniref:Uncharacterized protein n=1 Tax=Penicillium chrysogenum TaxID=5076 RepID=A0A167XBJ9_PENCH|nr:hypothetical protein EN45_027940 [Penicillium chrysogenum]